MRSFVQHADRPVRILVWKRIERGVSHPARDKISTYWQSDILNPSNSPNFSDSRPKLRRIVFRFQIAVPLEQTAHPPLGEKAAYVWGTGD